MDVKTALPSFLQPTIFKFFFNPKTREGKSVDKTAKKYSVDNLKL
jgi:hypothetical protein